MSSSKEAPTDRLLQRVAEQVERARSSPDPVERARIAASLQWYGGWALRFAIEECREQGMSWPVLGERVGVRQTTIFDQYSAGGPVIVARPHRSPGGRNDIWTMIWEPNGQAPLRQTATKLVHEVMAVQLGGEVPETVGRLYLAVHAMAHAQTAKGSPEPLLRTVGQVLDLARDIAAEEPLATADDRERKVWDILAELARVYERDQELIRVAAEVAEIRRTA